MPRTSSLCGTDKVDRQKSRRSKKKKQLELKLARTSKYREIRVWPGNGRATGRCDNTAAIIFQKVEVGIGDDFCISSLSSSPTDLSFRFLNRK